MQPKQNNQLPAAYPVYYPPQMQQWYPSQQQPYPQYLPPQHQEQPIRNPPYPLGYPFHLPPGNPNNTNPFK
uniref:Uncharacterized protein n=1 Tax=Panagrolaimus davidi TaxID=227884 RepID=A0A914Q432_9BILA